MRIWVHSHMLWASFFIERQQRRWKHLGLSRVRLLAVESR